MPHSPLIQKGSRGCCYLATRPNFRRSSAFWFACGKTLLQAIQSGHRRFRRACEGDGGTKYDFRALRLRIEAIISSYTMDFTSIFKGQILYFRGSKIKREKGSASNALPDSQRTAEPTAFSRVLTAFARFFAHIGWKKAVCQAHVSSRNQCVSHTQDSAKQADFSPVCGCFPCVRYTHKKINISATKGVVFVSGEPWVGSPWTPNVNYTRERIYRETEKEQQRECPFLRCAANRFPSAPTGIGRSGFLFLLFLCPKKDFVKDIFWFDYQS